VRRRRCFGLLLLAVTLVGGSARGQQSDASKSADAPLMPPIVFQPGQQPAPLETGPAEEKAQPAAPTRAAAVALEVVGPATQAQGQSVDYEILVRNTGAVAVAAVRIEEHLSTGVRLIHSEPAADAQKDRAVWSISALDAGAEYRIRVRVQPADSGDFIAQPTVHFAAAPGLRTRISRQPLAVTQSAPETAVRGQPVPFEIRVTNNTAEPLQHVVLRAKIPPSLQFMEGDVVEAEVGTLGANETRTVRLNATAVQPGPAVNEVTARAEGGLTAACQATVLVQAPGLVVRMDGPREATIGSEVLLRAELTNAGEQPVRGVGLLLTLPDGMDLLFASTGGSVDGANRQVVGWALGTVAGGERKAVTLKAAARCAGDWMCQAKARGEDVAETKATAALHIDTGPTLGLEIAGRDDAIDTGLETVYEVRVINRGGMPCRGIRVVTQVGDGLQVVQAEGATAAIIQQQQIPFDPLAELPARTEALYRFRVRASKAGEWRVRVRVDAEGLQKPLEKDVNLRVKGSSSQGSRTVVGTANSGVPR
jgi:uncharacterized repeat protein (TIGR01451 family)